MPLTNHKLESIPIEKIDGLGSRQSSARFDRSMEELGLLYPILVVKTNEGRYQVIDGRQRVVSYEKLGHKSIRAKVYSPGSDADTVTIASLVANVARSPNPASDLEAIEKLKIRNYTDEEIITVSGLTKTQYQQRLKLFSLIPELKFAFKQGKIALGVAQKVGAMSASDQRQLLQVFSENDEKLTHADVKEFNDRKVAETLGDELFEEVPIADWRSQAQQKLNELEAIVPPQILSRVYRSRSLILTGEILEGDDVPEPDFAVINGNVPF